MLPSLGPKYRRTVGLSPPVLVISPFSLDEFDVINVAPTPLVTVGFAMRVVNVAVLLAQFDPTEFDA